MNKDSLEIFITAGGSSNRMGQDKGSMLVNGKPMIRWVMEACENLAIPLSIIANKEWYSQSIELPVYSDLIENCGPLGGLHTALSYAKKEHVLYLSCDMPYLNSNVLEDFISRSNSAFPINSAIIENIRNPLFSIYHQSVLETVTRKMNNKELKMQLLYDEFMPFYVSLAHWENERPNPLKNVNFHNDIL